MQGCLVILGILVLAAVQVTVPYASGQLGGQVITVDTTKERYQQGETITVSVMVENIINEQHILMKIIDEDGNIRHTSQGPAAQDGTYADTIRADGALWTNSGTYKIEVLYGEAFGTTSFAFQTRNDMMSKDNLFEVDIGDSGTSDVEYSIFAGTVRDIRIDPDQYSLIIDISSAGEGELHVEFERGMIDANTNGCEGSDEPFIVLADGTATKHEEFEAGEQRRGIRLNFEESTMQIQIVGTCIIPEFGGIALIILLAGTTAAIVITSGGRLSRIRTLT